MSTNPAFSYQSLSVEEKLAFLKANSVDAPQEIEKLLKTNRALKYIQELEKLERRLDRIFSYPNFVFGHFRDSNTAVDDKVAIEAITDRLIDIVSNIERIDSRALTIAFNDGLRHFITQLKLAIKQTNYISFSDDLPEPNDDERYEGVWDELKDK